MKFFSVLQYFSLDVEGPEMIVLRSIPWEKVDFTVVQVEHMRFRGILFDYENSKKLRDELRNFFRQFLPEYQEKALLTFDIIFAKNI